MKASVTTSGINEATHAILRTVDAKTRKRAIGAASKDALDAVRKYYRVKGRALWINPSLPTHGSGRMFTGFAKAVEAGWFTMAPSSNGVTLRNKGAKVKNTTIGIVQKIEGGTIRAKRKKFLTIPMVPEAHGRRAREYSKDIAKLFTIKGKNGLFAQDGDKVKMIYALKRSITQKPWPNAIPHEAVYLDPFVVAIVSVIESKFEE